MKAFLLGLMLAQSPDCTVPPHLKTPAGCVALSTLEELINAGCALPPGFCFSVPWSEEQKKTRVVEVYVTGKGASAYMGKALELCEKLSTAQKIGCRLLDLQESNGPIRFQVRMRSE